MASKQQSTEGMIPQLAELIALREKTLRTRTASRGMHSHSGPALSPLRGRGMEYAESREYQHGDDARHMDWRITARTGKAHSKVFQAERERLTLIVADTSPRMFFGTKVRFKSVQAARAGAIAVWHALRDGDRLAALRGSTQEEPVKPMGGMRGALRVLDALRRWYGDQSSVAPAQLNVAITHAIRIAKPGTRVIVLADGLSLRNVPESDWSALSQHCEVIVLAMTDPLETMPPREDLAFQLTTNAKRVTLDLRSDSGLTSWAEMFSAPLEEAKQLLSRRRVRYHALATDADSDEWVNLLGRAPPMVA